ncbi:MULTISPECIES: ribosome hibernation-promoting factor, HPF/YfiA family [Dermacoccus]|uniref:Ribosome hibernation promoting factor n=2 Tax=Dermacoccus TaxID=57495 RepID=A0A075JIS5_9MICO|nr:MULTISPECIES: ribosome-associated translation inhibitor RaiA [Dermacoccus]AIF41247.1 30S ribosomal protein S30 [Dermacoccus nishinomiyaensis]MBO1758435.1 ribosome-associated translation inhibitor RaiA [Dermacoccus sp. NHGro5]MCT1605247.1 ribosome-associated translation inhibitor RaiA [Dermacoccus nishinomiyaensis]QQY24108.1 ribosome-associated translation inhibitor RaiA [Dermacoccus nishinomiyaensis]STD71158.1 ribosome hibernation promoting factor HPF [Dermacoccus nishinomiyaensis]
MEITVTGRHVEVPARLARHVEDKLAKVPQLDPRVMRCDVVITHEPNPRRAKEAYRVEVTCRSKRSVVRAEASADEEYAALDLVMGKLGERLRRQHDRRRIQRGQHRTMSVAEATADLPVLEIMPDTRDDAPEAAQLGEDPDCPVQLREKVHASAPMDVDEALREMELVGHDFYLYQDKSSGRPSLVYRRRGWSYGVIHLDVVDEAPDTLEETA